jgi:hypothetical protein
MNTRCSNVYRRMGVSRPPNFSPIAAKQCHITSKSWQRCDTTELAGWSLGKAQDFAAIPTSRQAASGIRTCSLPPSRHPALNSCGYAISPFQNRRDGLRLILQQRTPQGDCLGRCQEHSVLAQPSSGRFHDNINLNIPIVTIIAYSRD